MPNPRLDQMVYGPVREPVPASQLPPLVIGVVQKHLLGSRAGRVRRHGSHCRSEPVMRRCLQPMAPLPARPRTRQLGRYRHRRTLVHLLNSMAFKNIDQGSVRFVAEADGNRTRRGTLVPPLVLKTREPTRRSFTSIAEHTRGRPRRPRPHRLRGGSNRHTPGAPPRRHAREPCRRPARIGLPRTRLRSCDRNTRVWLLRETTITIRTVTESCRDGGSVT